MQSLAAKKASWWQSARSKLKVVGQWQFVAVVLPLLAVLFFACLAAFYIRASYHDHPSTRPSSSSAASPALHLLEPQLQPALASVRALLQQASVDKICAPDAAVGSVSVDPRRGATREKDTTCTSNGQPFITNSYQR